MRRYLSIPFFLLTLLLLGGCDFFSSDEVSNDTELMADEPINAPGEVQRAKKRWKGISSLKRSRFLRDPNKLHISAGKEMGLNPHYRKNADFLAERDSLVACGALIYVPDSTYYVKKPAKYSYPYLTPEAFKVLNELSERFQRKLKEKKQPAYSLYLTSALRTEESQIRLRKGNKNATRDTTSHLFGASFDISYWEFLRNSDRRAYSYKHIQNILTKTVGEMRNENKCLVIKENGQFCFHITAIQ